MAEQDSAGRILAGGEASEGRWWNWDPSRPSGPPSDWPWSSTHSTATMGLKLAAMQAAGHGKVCSFWEKPGDSRFKLVELFGGHHGEYEGPALLARTFVDSRTNSWLVEAALHIRRSTLRHYKLDARHTITVDELWPGTDPNKRLPVSMFEDGRGRVWFWSNCLLGDDSRGAIRGVLIHADGTVTHHAALEGVQSGRISVVAAPDDANVWLAVRDAGLFAVDQETLRGVPVAEPETNAFRVVQQIFHDGQDLYVIAGDANDLNEQGWMSSLWRRRAGTWKKLIGGLDSAGMPEQFADRRWRFTSDGLWLGAFGTGGWFVPRNGGEPRRIAWQIGSPFDTIHRWFQLKDGQMLALQFGRGGLLADAASLTVLPGSSSVQVFQPARPLIQTADGRVFAIRREQETTLSEWTGQEWRRHSFPDEARAWVNSSIATDARGGIWFVDQGYSGDSARWRAAVFDPATGQFQRLTSFRAGLQSHAGPLRDSRLVGDPSLSVVFSSDTRIGYVDRHWQLHLFNGQEWRQWHLSQIVHTGLWRSDERVPWFGGNGRLAIVLDQKVWEFDGLTGWKKTPQALPSKPEQPGTTVPSTEPPLMPEASALVADRRGVFWVVARKQLYRVGFGLRAAVFAPNEPQPFADGRKLTGALLDNAGNAFLQTTLPGREEIVLVPARGAPPDTILKVAQEYSDGVTLELSASGAQSPRFTWRVGGGPWQNAVTNTALRLDDLPAGRHRAQVAALDEQVIVDPTPAEITFDVRATPPERIENWIRQLGDPDFSQREAALRTLSRRPAETLPALRQAFQRETDRDRRWWLESAIQECESAGGK